MTVANKFQFQLKMDGIDEVFVVDLPQKDGLTALDLKEQILGWNTLLLVCD